MTIFFGEYGFKPDIPVAISDSDKVEWWEHVAEQAVDFFEDKEDYMSWVFSNYRTEDNRLVANGAWDLVVWNRQTEIIPGDLK